MAASQIQSLGEALKAAVIASGKSQKEIAREAGIKQPSLNRFMTGVRDDLKLSTASKLAAYLQLELRPVWKD